MGTYVNDKDIDSLLEKVDLVKIVSKDVNLNDGFGLCPFHKETTPSFYCDHDHYYCYGCGRGGNVFKYLQEKKELSFPKAISYLSELTGESVKIRPSKDPLEKDILEANKFAARYFYRELFGKRAGMARAYINKRKITDESIERFGLGYDDYKLKDFLIKEFGEDIAFKSGLVAKNKEGKFYDFFAGRLIFPVMNEDGIIVGFGGRILKEDKKAAKYKNSKESPVFHKSTILYGLNYARRNYNKPFILCEGYMDVLTLHQYGFDCAVGGLGTALTPHGAKLLSQFTKNVWLCYDSDDAGEKAAFKASSVLEEEGIKTKRLRFSPFKDPDEALKAGFDLREKLEEETWT